ncbi:MAG: ACP S-malonyltransferase, partial [Clostridium sp.]|nr:ACP S-malonyltransferase [Clostridium sp.]
MSKIAFIFPGQGAQVCGMGQEFYEQTETGKEVFDKASELLGFSVPELCFEKNDRLDLTEYTQPAMVTASIAMTKVFVEKTGITPSVTAGLSLGEYAAIAASGGMSELDAIRLVRQRGLLMQNAVPSGVGGMCAVLGMAAADIEKVLDSVPDVSIANYNCSGQIVITGKREGLEQAAALLKSAGAKRVLPLKVSGPFHSPLLQSAGEKLLQEIEKTAISPLKLPYVANVTAEMVTDRDEIAALLSRGVSSSVRWQQSVETMIKAGVDTFVEIGP